MTINNKKLAFIAASITLIVLVVSGIYMYNNQQQSSRQQSNNSNQNQIRISTTIYPIYEFTRQIAGDLIEVSNITPNGSEAHDFEPSPQQIAQIYEKQLLIFNGSGVDPWAEKLAQDLDSKQIKTLNLSQELKSDLLMSQEENANDPHFWLDPVLAQKQVDIILSKINTIDQKNSEIYQKNAENFKSKLSDLNTEYTNLLSNCSQSKIVTSHNAFAYLAKRYSFDIITIAGLDHDSEPSTQEIAEIIKTIKENGIKYVAFEELADPKLSQIIADEASAQTIVLNPIEGLTEEDQQNQQDYISISKDNLTNLRLMLECK
jgi:zinc transport system substrate-binding protein